MNEKLFQFIWQFQYFNQSGLFTTSGEAVEIVYPGSLNQNQGPDFTSAKIKIGNTLWVGSVELHLRSSDWHVHKHQHDKNYKNVVLHVVYENDVDIPHLYTIELKERIPRAMLKQYDDWMHSPKFIPCQDSILTVAEITRNVWLETCVIARLIRKSVAIETLLVDSRNHWEEVFWITLAKNFGITVNALAFEEMAKSVPINILAKHKSSQVQLEAMLLGQCNLLDDKFEEDYPQMLQREYLFLKNKYSLKPVHQKVHFLRMRPSNFPTLRLAQLAALIHQSSHLFSVVIEEGDLTKIKNLFRVTANDYWHYHFSFKDASDYREKYIGDEMVHNIIINTIVPVVFSYGRFHNREPLKEKALSWLQAVKAEKNSITKGFDALGVKCSNAVESQALIELKTQFCDTKRCLSCAMGNSILKRNQEIGK